MFKSIKSRKSMDNYAANKVILRRLSDLIENSQEVGFQKILFLAGITDLFEISTDGTEEGLITVGGADTEESSLDTVKKMNIINN